MYCLMLWSDFGACSGYVVGSCVFFLGMPAVCLLFCPYECSVWGLGALFCPVLVGVYCSVFSPLLGFSLVSLINIALLAVQYIYIYIVFHTLLIEISWLKALLSILIIIS